MADINTTILIKAQDEASAQIKKIADTTKAVGDGAKSSIGGVQALGAAVKSALGPLIGIAAAVEGLRKSLQLASDAQEATSKTMTVFRNNTQGLKSSIDELTKSYGMSTLEATKALGAMGDLFKPLGFAEQDALKLSETAVKLARDLASFNNLDTEDVLRDIQSALVGNTEAVRKYGVVLNETTLAQAAVNAGLDPKNLTPAQKSWLIMQEIIRSNTDALGDYQRTQDSFANTMRRLQTVAVEIATAFGSVVMEAIQPLASYFADIAELAMPYLLKGFQALGGVLQFITGLVKALLQAFDVLATFIVRSIGDVIMKAVSALAKALAQTLQLIANMYNKIADVARKVGVELPRITFDFVQATDEFSAGMDGVLKKVKEGKSLFEALGLAGKKAVEQTSQVATTIAMPVSAPVGGGGTTTEVKKEKANVTAQAIATTTDPFMATLMTFAQKFQDALSRSSQAFSYLINALESFATTLANRIGPVVDAVLMPFVQILDQFFIIVGEQFGNLIQALRPLLEVLVSNVIQTLALFVLQLVSLFQFVVPVIQFLAQLLAPFMKAVGFVLNLIYNVLAAIYNNIFVPIINVFIKAFNAIGGVFAGALNWVIDVINGVIDVINGILRWLRWGEIGKIGRISWQTIAEVTPVAVPSGASSGGATTTTSGTTSGGGLSVQTERPIYVNFVNNGVLAGFKDEDEFIAWVRQGLALASARG